MKEEGAFFSSGGTNRLLVILQAAGNALGRLRDISCFVCSPCVTTQHFVFPPCFKPKLFKK